jgi:S1-C subfamily serine protease
MSNFFSLRQLLAVFATVFLAVWGRTTIGDRALSSVEGSQQIPTNTIPIPTPSNSSPSAVDLGFTEIARSITVKIAAPDFIGSGTIVGFKNGIYTVITNAHVLRSADRPYQIITKDRVVHRSKVINYRQLKNYDLALLQFRDSVLKYPVAKIGKSGALQVGDRLVVGGFTEQSSQGNSDNFLLQSGAVSLILDRSIESGYRIGYTHQIFRGMSGGPVIDRAGKLVGINGLLNDPVWKTNSKFTDNSVACEPLQLLIDRSSLAISIDDIIKLLPRSKWWKIDTSLIVTVTPETHVETQERGVLQQSAKKALSCQN